MADATMLDSHPELTTMASTGSDPGSHNSKQKAARPTLASLAKTIKPPAHPLHFVQKAPRPTITSSRPAIRPLPRRDAGQISSRAAGKQPALPTRPAARSTAHSSQLITRPTATPIPWTHSDDRDEPPALAGHTSPWPKLPYELVQQILTTAARFSCKHACAMSLVNKTSRWEVSRLVATHKGAVRFVEHAQAAEIVHLGNPQMIRHLWLASSTEDSLRLVVTAAAGLESLCMATYDLERLFTEYTFDRSAASGSGSMVLDSAPISFPRGLSLTLDQPPHWVCPMYERVCDPEVWLAFSRAVTRLRLTEFRIDDERKEAAVSALLKRLPNVTHLALPAFRCQPYTPVELMRRMRRVKRWLATASQSVRVVVLVVDWEDWVTANGWTSSARRAFDRLVASLKGLDERFYVVAGRAKAGEEAKARRRIWEEERWVGEDVWDKATRTRRKVCGEVV
ncbi:hypothetical protein PUNSTDRAFT_127359 [Punctularia strigosozonata HHB-11173 SS5]|uniref:uncharacterized protein n=1 Tax=Punctularia strigosozonata (strain HHB-11173) TaxID=741275 RepID=UPI00044184E4|nr:uncharacterized protein PUNSTDRAFT_127359 [Punctularia strigosozonata HHB-11173 SS5]EIN06693.1 hypothetical protein PUNSTDRAFT_127359 [Punctularia strigosozonata HHB-11173 SS5]